MVTSDMYSGTENGSPECTLIGDNSPKLKSKDFLITEALCKLVVYVLTMAHGHIRHVLRC